jgi:hypothetical protein
MQSEADQLGNVITVSSFYETEPVATAQPWFLNCAVKLDTEKMPNSCLKEFWTWSVKWGVDALTQAAKYRYRYSAVWNFGRRDQGTDNSPSCIT